MSQQRCSRVPRCFSCSCGALALGLFVGILLGVSQRLPEHTRPLLTFGSAFAVSVTVFWLLNVAAVDAGALPSLVAPLVSFLSGAMLTTSVVELTTGQIVSGGARLAAGFMQLVLLALGIVAAATLVGVPAIALGPAQQPLGAVAPWGRRRGLRSQRRHPTARRALCAAVEHRAAVRRLQRPGARRAAGRRRDRGIPFLFSSLFSFSFFGPLLPRSCFRLARSSLTLSACAGRATNLRCIGRLEYGVDLG